MTNPCNFNDPRALHQAILARDANQNPRANHQVPQPRNPNPPHALGQLTRAERERDEASSARMEAHWKTSGLISDLEGVMHAAFALAIDSPAFHDDHPEGHAIKVLIELAKNMAKSASEAHEAEFQACKRERILENQKFG